MGSGGFHPVQDLGPVQRKSGQKRTSPHTAYVGPISSMRPLDCRPFYLERGFHLESFVSDTIWVHDSGVASARKCLYFIVHNN